MDTNNYPTQAKVGLSTFFHEELKDIYWAEKALLQAIPQMIKNATDVSLIEALVEHLEVTKEQVTRLEEVFQLAGLKVQAKECKAMQDLIEEAHVIMVEQDEPLVRDAGIIAAAQKVEHYEIATYRTLKAHASSLGLDDAALLLERTLREEKEADQALTEIEEDHINAEAVNASADEVEG
jgi:ferritin-like metal-binding protein YciE